MKIEIWIRGCKLCETENQEAIENFEQIVRKAGYTIEEKRRKRKNNKNDLAGEG